MLYCLGNDTKRKVFYVCRMVGIFLHILILLLLECSDAEPMDIESPLQLKVAKNGIFQNQLKIFKALNNYLILEGRVWG